MAATYQRMGQTVAWHTLEQPPHNRRGMTTVVGHGSPDPHSAYHACEWPDGFVLSSHPQYRNDNGQGLANLSTLFDIQSLLANKYGRLPNDRPHQFKFDGSYRTPWRLLLSGSFRAQSGIPFNALIPHPAAGDNEGFEVPRGTALDPLTGTNRTPK